MVRYGILYTHALKRREFDSLLEHGLYMQNGRQAYGVLDALVKEIPAALPPSDTESITVADFLKYFCQQLLGIFYIYGGPNLSYSQRIQALLTQYYTQAPMALKLAKLKGLT